LLCLIVFSALLFAANTTYSRNETVSGWVAPEGGLIRLTARAGGIVEAIQAHEGDSISAATPVVALKLSTDLATGDAGKAMDNGLSAETKASAAQAMANKAKLEAQVTEMNSRRSLLLQELIETEGRVKVAEQRQSLAEADVTRSEPLLAKGFLSKSNMDHLKSAVLSAAQDASSTRTAALDLQRQIADLDHEIAAAPADIAAEEAQADAARASLAQRRVTSQTQSTFVAMAPIDGRIVAIPVERGQTVPAGAAVAVMTPKGSALTAELYVPSRAAGFIKSGQAVRLMYQAFPYQTFGAGHGVVTSVSRTVLAPSEIAIPGLTVQEPVFRVRVALDRQSVPAYGHDVPLQPGMLLTADVVIDKRSLLQWLLDPLYAVGRRA
jgi:membrane fusion protein